MDPSTGLSLVRGCPYQFFGIGQFDTTSVRQCGTIDINRKHFQLNDLHHDCILGGDDTLESDTKYGIILCTDARFTEGTQPMAKVKHVLLLPVNFNDGSKVPKDVLDQIFDNLSVLAGGHRVSGEGTGAYRMKNGQKQVDRSLEVWVAVEEEEIPELRKLVGQIGAKLGQESMYLERTGGTVEFVPSLVLKG